MFNFQPLKFYLGGLLFDLQQNEREVKMRQLLIMMCGMLFMASMAVADDTTTETCANGAGIVITGNLSGHKYCLSNQNMSWWNAYAWCDSIGRSLFDASMCCINRTNCPHDQCPEFLDTKINKWGWSATPIRSDSAYQVLISTSRLSTDFKRSHTGPFALCY